MELTLLGGSNTRGPIMTDNGESARGAAMINELREFASFPASTQRYIRRSIDIALFRDDATTRGARDRDEAVSIQIQALHYERLPEIRAGIPIDVGTDWLEPFLSPLITVSAFDLAQERLLRFGAYRFLYERILGPSVRPWLLSAFSAASSLPHIPPQLRRDLLNSIPENAATAPGWTLSEPCFIPDWIDKSETDERAALN
jgi:hypothetical protein